MMLFKSSKTLCNLLRLTPKEGMVIYSEESVRITDNSQIRKPLQVEVRVFADLRKCINDNFTSNPTEAFSLDLESGTTIAQLMTLLEITNSETIIALVNGLRQPHDVLLQDGDRVGLFPPVGGG